MLPYKDIYGIARYYLLDFREINEEILERHLSEWKKAKPSSMNELLFGMLNSASNKQRMRNAIGDVEILKPYLENFSPDLIISKYDDDWKKLFIKIQKNYTPPGPMEIDRPRSFWVIFCKSILSASRFLSRFSSVDDFNEFVGQFYLNEYTRVALPLLLAKEVFGMEFALACDFLKENGYPKFIKPDTHIKTIFKGIGISRPESDDYEVFKDVIKYSEEIGEVPYAVDKLFWLIGSGDFYLSNIKIRTNRGGFINFINYWSDYMNIAHNARP